MVKQIENNIIDLETGEVLGKPITDKQMYTIKIIENNLHISFKGNTYQDAWKFINTNMDASKQASHIFSLKQKAIDKFINDDITELTPKKVQQIRNTGFGSMTSYFRHVESKYSDLFNDEEVDDIMPYIEDGEYNPFI